MKKLYALFLSIISVLTFSSIKVNAFNYQGETGYDGNSFRYITDKTNVNVNLVIEKNGETPKSLPMEYIKEPNKDGFYIVNYIADVGSEYYFRVCDNNDKNKCQDYIDPFSEYINAKGDRNVIIDKDGYNKDWLDTSTISLKPGDRMIYAFEPQGFIKNLNFENKNSIFGNLTIKSSEDENVQETSLINSANLYASSSIGGINYLEVLNNQYSYLEISNLYDADNYFFVNRNFTNKGTTIEMMQEYQKMILCLKNLGYNIVLKTNFTNVSPSLKNLLLSMSSISVVDNKLNFNDPIVKKYITDVYFFWKNNYKIDGFYIEDAQNYNQAFLKSLIKELTNNIPNSSDFFVYTNESSLSGFYTSDTIQNILYGSLKQLDGKGILNSKNNIDDKIMNDLVNALFSGNFDGKNPINDSILTINNFGDLKGLDIISKLQATIGLSTQNQTFVNKLKVGLATIFSSAGIPRVVAGNEFLNNQSSSKNASLLPIDDPNYVDKNDLVCIPNSDSICYVIGNSKSINWNAFRNNQNYVSIFSNYRKRYPYQFPSIITMNNAINYVVDKDALTKGVIYIRFDYNPVRNGEMKTSHMILNLTDDQVKINKISTKNYDNIYSTVGKISVSEDGNTLVDGNTFYTFTEVKNDTLPQWAYILIGFGLIGILIVVRLVVGGINKKKGIVPNKKLPRKERKKLKKQAKEKNKQKGIFEEFVLEDPLIKELKEKRNEKNTQKQEDKKASKLKKEDKETSKLKKEDKNDEIKENDNKKDSE